MSRLQALATEIKALRVGDVPAGGYPARICCPVCDKSMLDDEVIPTKALEKVAGWTVAQLLAFMNLYRNGSYTLPELLSRTSGGVMPGIGGALVGDVGTIGVTDYHGIFVGIEPDGYTHS